ncbi:hypothetical protein L596_024690 [Steinernema carpocapsae]|uniref:Uncharacterized protein n=1 Tax=Steinernema carpocapsae TaxID=34508 RepID=A0A4U5M5H4_STECR|nr:hypothetical protein L596_024690 [Steinernema carpocapsae]
MTLTFRATFLVQGDTKNTPCGTRQGGCVWLRKELSRNDQKQQKLYAIKELLDLASFACDNLTKMTAFLEKTGTRPQDT